MPHPNPPKLPTSEGFTIVPVNWPPEREAEFIEEIKVKFPDTWAQYEPPACFMDGSRANAVVREALGR